jgi:superfamily II DNA or RNA helicase
MQELRPYQAASVGAFYDALEMDYSRILLTLPTGTGKTTTFADIIKKWLEYFEGGVLVLAHRMELLEQAQTRIIGHCGLDPFWDIGLEIGDQRASQQAKVVCGSVLTVKNKNRLQWFKPGLIITDEAHRAAARSYQMIYERFGVIEGTCKHLGVTATPKRFDKQSLFAITPTGDSVQIYDKKARKTLPADKKTSVFEYLCYEFSLLDAITQGWLVPVRGVCISTDTDLTNVESDSEDFNNRELAKAVDNANRTNLAISKWKEIASDRPTIVFCAGIEHAYHSAELWREAGYTAEALGGEEAQDK